MNQEQLELIAKQFYTAHKHRFGKEPDYLRVDDFGVVEGVTEEYCCGSWEIERNSLPWVYLSMTEEELKKERQDEIDALQKRKEEDIQRYKEAKEREERELFIKLKNKYENE